MEKYGIGLDIGGTKCAVTLGELSDGVRIVKKEAFATAGLSPMQVIDEFSARIAAWTAEYAVTGIGISCGGPLDAKRGVVQSPPNLPHWDNVPIVDILVKRFGLPTYLQNDANACAVAEWKYGAGQGCDNMVFLTFGTGFGAGLILDGKLFSGANDNAGEVGHVRLTAQGPVGYGKAGSFEGYCSGGGIRRLALAEAEKWKRSGKIRDVQEVLGDPDTVSAKTVAERAAAGEPFSVAIYQKSGRALGRALSLLIDLLNPQRIVIGGVFMRAQNLLLPAAEKVIKKEALTASASVCKILPAALGENVGDYAALALSHGEY